MAKSNSCEKDPKINVLEAYDATKLLKSPFKVVLYKSVYEVLDDAGKIIETVIPDPDGLVKAVAQGRVLHPHKLTGGDLKFLRSALGKKSKELARNIALTPEHLSRCENDVHPLSPQSEMLVRIYTFVSTLPFTSKKTAAGEQIGNLVAKVFEQFNVKAVHPVEEEIVLEFVLGRRRSNAGKACTAANDDGQWDQPTLRHAV